MEEIPDGQKLMTLGAVVAFAVLGAASGHATPSGPLYIDDASGNIGTVNLATGAVHVIGNSGVGLTDIGFTSNGNLYGTSYTSLYSINQSTAASSLVGNYGSAGAGGMNALVGSGAGLYAASFATSSLYAVGVSPFSISTLNGSTGGGAAGDLAFASAGGALYETLSNGDLDKITITGRAVHSTIVGNTGLDDVYGLATGDDGITYAVAGTEIYSINLSTAALDPLFNYGGFGLGDADGTAFTDEATGSGPGPVPVPEPASIAILGMGLLGIGMILRRRRT